MKRPLDAMMADRALPVAGDLLRLAFHASRFHPDDVVRQSIGEAIDALLDASQARAIAAAGIAEAFRGLPASPLEPMLASEDDTRLVARLWRLSALAFRQQGPRLVVGSADAVGAGHGAILDAEGQATACTRRSRRLSSDAPFVNLGIARRPTDLAACTDDDKARLVIDRAGGVRILVELDTRVAPPRVFQFEKNRICVPPGPLGLSPQGFREAGLRIDRISDKSLAIAPVGPEGAIRLTAHCAAGSMILVDLSNPADGRQSIVVQLAGLDRAARVAAGHRLALARVSSRGMLAQWASLPPLPIALPLAPALRAAVATHYATT